MLAHLAAAVASLPQTAAQLADVLHRAKDRYDLSADSLVSSQDADLLIATARLHLDNVREPAVRVYRHLDAAQNQAAHVVATDRTDDPLWSAPFTTTAVRRPEHEPPTSPGGRAGPPMPR